MKIEKRIEELGLYLPEPAKVPNDVVLDFAWVRTFGNRVYVSGHGPQAPDGKVIGESQMKLLSASSHLMGND